MIKIKHLNFIALVLSLFCLVSLLVGCESKKINYFKYDEMIAKTTKIDIIDIKLGTSRSDGINEEIVGTISKEQIDDFLLDLSKIGFIKPLKISNPNFPEGLAFLVYYSDGNHDIIHQYSTFGEIDEIKCSKEEYDYLVNKYFYNK